MQLPLKSRLPDFSWLVKSLVCPVTMLTRLFSISFLGGHTGTYSSNAPNSPAIVTRMIIGIAGSFPSPSSHREASGSIENGAPLPQVSLLYPVGSPTLTTLTYVKSCRKQHFASWMCPTRRTVPQSVEGQYCDTCFQGCTQH